MKSEAAGEIEFLRFVGLDGRDDVRHAVLTRHGGVSRPPFASLNLGHTVGDDPAAVDENHARALGLFALDASRVVSCHQVHGARVAVVGIEHLGFVAPATDALVTQEPGVALLQRFADCAPVVFYDSVRRVLGLAHAGWRGVARGVVHATVRTMVEVCGCSPRSIWAGIGPAIGPCCFEVGPEVEEAVCGACDGDVKVSHRSDGRIVLDLPAAISAQLRACGVRAVESSGLCTACRVDRFYSHRAEHGRTGRFGVIVALHRGETNGTDCC
ncbi:MAG: peptidoglycan editing factor PgeF [Chloroflexi bacterium]|nr:peptidoglycan editing factor PgeF [Chloroflexota bacterium]